MRKQKKDEKGYYSFSSSAVRSAVIIYGRKNAIFVGKGWGFFYKFCKRLQKKESRRFNLLGLHWKGLLFNYTVKRGINFKMSNTLYRERFAVLCLRIGTQLTSTTPPHPWGKSHRSMKVGTFNVRERKTSLMHQSFVSTPPPPPPHPRGWAGIMTFHFSEPW